MKQKREELNKEKLHCLTQLRNLRFLIEPLEDELRELYEERRYYSEKFKRVDYALAEIDGRLKKIAAGRRTRKEVKLSIDQIRKIAEKLGVKIDES